jgi:hypothetical protein
MKAVIRLVGLVCSIVIAGSLSPSVSLSQEGGRIKQVPGQPVRIVPNKKPISDSLRPKLQKPYNPQKQKQRRNEGCRGNYRC